VNIIIQALIIYTVALPLIFLNATFLAGYFATGAESLPFWYYIVFTLLTIVSTIITVAGSLIMYVAISFKYFSLVEEKEQIGLKRQIEQMGGNQLQDV
jgi:peptidoglycan biosynthesis protein MviN/MurJ (putative lipid II flippase)